MTGGVRREGEIVAFFVSFRQHPISHDVMIVVCGGGAKAEEVRIVVAVVRRSQEVSAFGLEFRIFSRYFEVLCFIRQNSESEFVF